jgi:hypothetical protein
MGDEAGIPRDLDRAAELREFLEQLKRTAEALEAAMSDAAQVARTTTDRKVA